MGFFVGGGGGGFFVVCFLFLFLVLGFGFFFFFSFFHCKHFPPGMISKHLLLFWIQPSSKSDYRDHWEPTI